VRIAVLPSTEQAGVYAAQWVAARLRTRVSTHKQASLALSGGTTAGPLIAALAHADVPWKRIQVFQVDERVAPSHDPARNLDLLDPLPIARGQVISMSVTLPRLEVAVAKYAMWLPERLDVVHLGLGDDGHTASWPPGDPVVDSDQPVALVDTFNGYRRITLTPGPVNDARHRLLFVCGASKAEPLAAYVRGDADHLPIGQVHRTGTLLVADAAAASLLRPDEIG
jgi:6-phosphogluconolactonase/glucosamine-6-phosphate isomerase/deaminase